MSLLRLEKIQSAKTVESKPFVGKISEGWAVFDVNKKQVKSILRALHMEKQPNISIR